MKKYAFPLLFLLVVFPSMSVAGDSKFFSHIIRPTDEPLNFRVSRREVIKVTNFTQQTFNFEENANQSGYIAFFEGPAGLPGVIVLTAAHFATNKTPHEDVFIAGSGVIYIAPVPGATLFLTYQRNSN